MTKKETIKFILLILHILAAMFLISYIGIQTNYKPEAMIATCLFVIAGIFAHCNHIISEEKNKITDKEEEHKILEEAYEAEETESEDWGTESREQSDEIPERPRG